MITETRKTISGTEYWDKKEKRSLFVPTGEEPGFEVTVHPESMAGGYLTKDKLAIGEAGTALILSNKTIKQLHDYAASVHVEIPADVKKKEDIIDLLS